MRGLILIPLGLCLAGCAATGVPVAPTAGSAGTHAILEPVETPSRADTRWWTHFNDPVLEGLVETSLASDLDAAQARDRLRQAEAEAGFKARAGGRAMRVSSSGAVRDGAGLWGRIARIGDFGSAGRAALARLEAAEYGTDEARRAVLAEVAQSYADMRYFQASRAFRVQDRASRRETLQSAMAQARAGRATRLDVMSARSLLAETEAELPRLDSEITRSRKRLAALLGVRVQDLRRDLAFRGRQPAPVEAGRPGIPADLLRARSDIRRAERLYAEAVADLPHETAARYPGLRLSGMIPAPQEGALPATPLADGLAMPVFKASSPGADRDAAEARAGQAYLQWRVAVLNAVEEVEASQLLLRSARKAARAAQDSVEAASRALSAARGSLAAGDAVAVAELLERERALSAARGALAQNMRDAAVAYVQLHVALGRGHPVSPEKMEIDRAPSSVSSRHATAVDLTAFN